jgi:prepilin-type N-terminal cleavage/methylation domain-containing protein
MRRTPQGFTLLELLLSVVMTAIIAASLAASLYIAFRARISAQQAVEATRAVDGVGDVVSRDLANALPPSQTTGALAGTFIGAIDSLDFYCTGQESKANVQGDCKHVQYAVVPNATNASRNDLVRYVTTNLLSPTLLDPTQETICRGVQSFSLGYFDGANWNDTWDSSQQTNSLPVAVQLTLVLLPSRPDAEAIQTVRIIALPCGVPNTTQLALPGGGL